MALNMAKPTGKGELKRLGVFNLRMKPYYYVYRVGNDLYEARYFEARYTTLKEATIAAESLANQHKGKTFEILKCVAISRVAKPVITFFMDGVRPES